MDELCNYDGSYFSYLDDSLPVILYTEPEPEYLVWANTVNINWEGIYQKVMKTIQLK